MNVKLVIEHGNDAYFVAQCPSLKSCWSQGRSGEEAVENIKEAIALYLAAKRKETVDEGLLSPMW